LSRKDYRHKHLDSKDHQGTDVLEGMCLNQYERTCFVRSAENDYMGLTSSSVVPSVDYFTEAQLQRILNKGWNRFVADCKNKCTHYYLQPPGDSKRDSSLLQECFSDLYVAVEELSNHYKFMEEIPSQEIPLVRSWPLTTSSAEASNVGNMAWEDIPKILMSFPATTEASLSAIRLDSTRSAYTTVVDKILMAYDARNEKEVHLYLKRFMILPQLLFNSVEKDSVVKQRAYMLARDQWHSLATVVYPRKKRDLLDQ